MEHRAEIKFCVKLKKTATEMSETFKSAYGEECLSKTNVFERHKRFEEGRESLQDEQKSCPSASTTEVMLGRKPNFECSNVRRNDRDR
jgi:hypothetical protein